MEEILELLEKWATATRFAKSRATVPNRASDVTIFDALGELTGERKWRPPCNQSGQNLDQ
jgi:hypothetical protein